MRTHLALLPLFAVVLAGCGSDDAADGGSGLEGITWVLTEGEGRAGPMAALDTARVTLRLEPGSDEVGGVSGCNHYFGTAQVADGSVSFGGLGGTEMGCDQPLMDLERNYLDALAGVDTVELDGDTMVLEGPDERLVFEPEPEAPTAALLDTRWVLESVIEGDGPDGSVASAMDPAELTLGDGTLALASSCLQIDAKWVEQGSEYQITESAFDYADPDAACFHDDPEQQAIASVVDSAFTAEVDGDVLTLHATRSDTGLQFRAAD